MEDVQGAAAVDDSIELEEASAPAQPGTLATSPSGPLPVPLFTPEPSAPAVSPAITDADAPCNDSNIDTALPIDPTSSDIAMDVSPALEKDSKPASELNHEPTSHDGRDATTSESIVSPQTESEVLPPIISSAPASDSNSPTSPHVSDPLAEAQSPAPLGASCDVHEAEDDFDVLVEDDFGGDGKEQPLESGTSPINIRLETEANEAGGNEEESDRPESLEESKLIEKDTEFVMI